MFETTKDILNIVAAASIGLVALLLSVFIYQLITIIRDFRRLSKSVKEKIEQIDALLRTIKDKLEHSATYFGMLVELIRRIFDYIKEKRTNNEKDTDKNKQL